MKITPILSHFQEEEIGQISCQKSTVSDKKNNSAPLLITPNKCCVTPNNTLGLVNTPQKCIPAPQSSVTHSDNSTQKATHLY
jgi:hypothetical protein